MISAARIIYSGLMLTSYGKESRSLKKNAENAPANGTLPMIPIRHPAAVGISENTDAAVVVVSEETGIVSMARDGALKRPLSTDELKTFLNDYYSITNSGLSSFLRKIVKRETKEGRA